MKWLDKLLGRQPQQQAAHPPPPRPGAGPRDADAQAIERYRYLLRTAPPDQIEQAHAEAFAQLTPQQRQQVLEQLGSDLPPGERPTDASPQSLARAATRAEMRRPGTMERSLGGRGMGLGGMMAGGLLGSLAGAFIGTAIAQEMFDDQGGDAGAMDDPQYGDAGGGQGDYGGGDFAGGDFGGGDF